MSALNFPNHRPDNSPLQVGDQYTGDNEVTYIFDGSKWIGHSVGQVAGTNSISNAGKVLQVDPSGNIVTPKYVFPATSGTNGQVLVWPSSGNTLVWANQSGSGGAGGYATTSTLVNGSYSASLGVDGYLNLVNGLDGAGALI
jgi:hypothetical protein